MQEASSVDIDSGAQNCLCIVDDTVTKAKNADADLSYKMSAFRSRSRSRLGGWEAGRSRRVHEVSPADGISPV